MRIIKTEIYFSVNEVVWPYEENISPNPGIAAAFFRADQDSLNSLEALGPIDGFYGFSRATDNDVPLFLDTALRGGRHPSGLFDERPRDSQVYNGNLIAFLYGQDIILEASPPHGLPLGKLIGGASMLSVGAYVGTMGVDSPILFLSVPGGILLVGAAIGLSKAFERGLNIAIDRAMKPTRARRKVERPLSGPQ